MLDYGIEGLYQTFESLNNSQIRFFGAGYNLKQARTPFIKKIFVGNQNISLVVFSAFEYRKLMIEILNFMLAVVKEE